MNLKPSAFSSHHDNLKPFLGGTWQQSLFHVFLVMGAVATIVGASWAIGSTGFGIWITFGLVAAGVGVMIINNPPLGVYLLVVFIYLNLSDVLEVSFGIPSINKALVALVAVSILGSRAIIRGQPIHFRRAEILVAAYFFTATLSTFVNPGGGSFLSEAIDTAKDLIILVIITQMSAEEHAWKKMQWLLILSAGFLALLTTYQIVSGNTSNEFWGLANAPIHQITSDFDNVRPTGPLVDPNYYAQILLMILPLAVYRTIGEETLGRKSLAAGCLLLIVASIIFTYSRSALVMLIIVTFLIVRERKLNIYAIGGLALAAYVMFIPFLPAGYTERILTITTLTESANQQTEESFRGRTSEMIVAVQMFRDNPLLGVGFGSYHLNYLDYSVRLGLDDRLETREAHSLYLEVAAETGILGIGTFSAMLITIHVMLRRARRQLSEINRADLVPWIAGLQYGLLAYMFTSVFLHDDYVRYFRLSIALAVGGIALVDTLVKEHERRTQESETL